MCQRQIPILCPTLVFLKRIASKRIHAMRFISLFYPSASLQIGNVIRLELAVGERRLYDSFTVFQLLPVSGERAGNFVFVTSSGEANGIKAMCFGNQFQWSRPVYFHERRLSK